MCTRSTLICSKTLSKITKMCTSSALGAGALLLLLHHSKPTVNLVHDVSISICFPLGASLRHCCRYVFASELMWLIHDVHVKSLAYVPVFLSVVFLRSMLISKTRRCRDKKLASLPSDMAVQWPYTRIVHDDVDHYISTAWQHDGIASHGVRRADIGCTVPASDAFRDDKKVMAMEMHWLFNVST